MKFSYFCFKSRDLMKTYFANAYKRLNKDGIFLVDAFGGSQCFAPIEDSVKHDNFTYYWDQVSFDPVSNEALFYIHFKVKGKKVEKVFTYDWRLWTLPEIREIMREVGFKKTHVYWEGTAKEALKAAVELSIKHIHGKLLPDKAIDVIDEAGRQNE